VRHLLHLSLMTLHINGQPREFTDGLTLSALVVQLGFKSDRLAIELNRDIVSRAQWDTTALKDGDRLEIVHFVGGG
jgi:sulfur carrier protein